MSRSILLYQNMINWILERIAAERVQSEQLARETAERKKAEVWETLLPKWDTETATYEGKKIYRKLWWNGIPPKYRGVVWKKALGNELEITEATYNIALEKARMQIEALGDAAFDGQVTTIIQNTQDVFPELKMFGPKTHATEEQPFHRDLVNVCLAYMLYRPDVDTLTGVHVSVIPNSQFSMLIPPSTLPASSFSTCLPLTHLSVSETFSTATFLYLSCSRTSLP